MITAIAYFKREGDEEIISEMISNLEKMSEDELIAEYNRVAKRGLFAAHGQALYLFSMRRVFMIQFGASPIELIGGNLLKITSSEVTIKDIRKAASEPTEYDMEMLSRLRREVRAFGKMKSQELINWWNFEH